MRILAIETSETAGSVAAAADDNLLLQLQLDRQTRSAQSLAPALKSLLEQVAWRPTDVALVAVSLGPGSFTGLRVGVTAAKTFAYAVGADVLGVDTLQTIAAGVPPDVQQVSVAVDAQRGQVVAQRLARSPDGHFAALDPATLLDSTDWITRLAPGEAVAGPVLRKLAERIPPQVRVLPPEYWEPTAAAVAAIALRGYRAGQRDDLWSLAPRYSRRSAAEEKWEANERTQQ